MQIIKSFADTGGTRYAETGLLRAPCIAYSKAFTVKAGGRFAGVRCVLVEVRRPSHHAETGLLRATCSARSEGKGVDLQACAGGDQASITLCRDRPLEGILQCL